ncbi:MAG: hypothetical protein HC811_10415 [Flammeovirgaceae bacterium]|nr:hypothetical protein [Flammeovirgaceae bacterium]
MRFIVLFVVVNFFWLTATSQVLDSMSYYNNTKKPVISDQQITEYAPTIQADGKTLIFEANQANSSTFKLFSSNLDGSGWTKPVSLDKINSSGDSLDLIGGPSISFDGNILYFFRSVGMQGNMEIFYSIREKDGWGEPINIGSPINTDGYEGFPSISADGSTLYFVRMNLAGPVSKELKRYKRFALQSIVPKKMRVAIGVSLKN